MSRRRRWVGCVLGILIFASCRFPRNDPGIARVTIDPGKIEAKAAYLISLSGPVFMMDVATSEDTTWISLPEGTWTIEARLLDCDGKTLASGTARNVKVASGATSRADIALSGSSEDPYIVDPGTASVPMPRTGGRTALLQ